MPAMTKPCLVVCADRGGTSGMSIFLLFSRSLMGDSLSIFDAMRGKAPRMEAIETFG